MADDNLEIAEDHRNLKEWSVTNGTGDIEHDFPIDMRFNKGHELSIITYSVLMVFSGIANITVLVILIKRRKKSPSRMNIMLMHLAIADLLVSDFSYNYFNTTVFHIFHAYTFSTVLQLQKAGKSSGLG